MYSGNEGKFYPGASGAVSYGQIIQRGEVKMMIDTIKGEISFRICGQNFEATQNEILKGNLFIALSSNSNGATFTLAKLTYLKQNQEKQETKFQLIDARFQNAHSD